MKAPIECGLIAVKLSLHLCDPSLVSVSDPSERLGCHVSSATLLGLTLAPSLLPLTLKITWREFFNRQKRAIYKDGFALVLTKSEIVTNEGLASVRALCWQWSMSSWGCSGSTQGGVDWQR